MAFSFGLGFHQGWSRYLNSQSKRSTGTPCQFFTMSRPPRALAWFGNLSNSVLSRSWAYSASEIIRSISRASSIPSSTTGAAALAGAPVTSSTTSPAALIGVTGGASFTATASWPYRSLSACISFPYSSVRRACLNACAFALSATSSAASALAQASSRIPI